MNSLAKGGALQRRRTPKAAHSKGGALHGRTPSISNSLYSRRSDGVNDIPGVTIKKLTLTNNVPAASKRTDVIWPHAPLHKLAESGSYFVTAGTYHKLHHFHGPARLQVLHRGLLTVAREFDWQLEAWAVFSNHYHFVAHSPKDAQGAESLSKMLGLLHEKTSKWVNRLDSAKGRVVWHNFWETKLTYEKSYLARLNYVHRNAVKHGLVAVANQYPWCSAGWFELTARPAQIETIYGFKVDKLRVFDEYEVAPDW